MRAQRRNPDRWQQVDGIWHRWCAPCATWKAHTLEHFHKNTGRIGGLQNICRPCNIAQVVKAERERNQHRAMCMKRAKLLAATLPPLKALDAITEAWGDLRGRTHASA